MKHTPLRSFLRVLVPLTVTTGLFAAPAAAEEIDEGVGSVEVAEAPAEEAPVEDATTAAAAGRSITVWNATDSQTANSYWEPRLNQPSSYVSPVNYSAGNAQIKITILSKPSTRPMKALVCFWRHAQRKFQYETCKSAGIFSRPGTYTANLGAPRTWWKKGGTYDWRQRASIGRIMLVDPNSGRLFMNSKCGRHCYAGGDLGKHVPVRMSSTLVFNGG